MRISDGRSDRCASDLPADGEQTAGRAQLPPDRASCQGLRPDRLASCPAKGLAVERVRPQLFEECNDMSAGLQMKRQIAREDILPMAAYAAERRDLRRDLVAKKKFRRSEEHTSELPSLMRISD